MTGYSFKEVWISEKEGTASLVKLNSPTNIKVFKRRPEVSSADENIHYFVVTHLVSTGSCRH